MYKTERLELRLSRRDIELLDQVRGATSRSAWIRHQIMRAAHTPDPDLEGLVTRPPLRAVEDPIQPESPMPPT